MGGRGITINLLSQLTGRVDPNSSKVESSPLSVSERREKVLCSSQIDSKMPFVLSRLI